MEEGTQHVAIVEDEALTSTPIDIHFEAVCRISSSGLWLIFCVFLMSGRAIVLRQQLNNNAVDELF